MSSCAAGTKVRWGRRDADSLLAELGDVLAVGRLCPACGSNLHGRPMVEGFAGASLARAAGLSLVAVGESPVGVDLELAGSTAPPRIAMHARDIGDPLVVWVRKEAILKATGTGLRVEPSSFWLDTGGAPHGLPDASPTLRVVDLAIPGFVAALAQ